jgi:hypothetical protein
MEDGTARIESLRARPGAKLLEYGVLDDLLCMGKEITVRETAAKTAFRIAAAIVAASVVGLGMGQATAACTCFLTPDQCCATPPNTLSSAKPTDASQSCCQTEAPDDAGKTDGAVEACDTHRSLHRCDCTHEAQGSQHAALLENPKTPLPKPTASAEQAVTFQALPPAPSLCGLFRSHGRTRIVSTTRPYLFTCAFLI